LAAKSLSLRLGFAILFRKHLTSRVDWWSHSFDPRLAAILAADVAGYSRLMGADEEGSSNA
jgi:hypothetical protein